MPSRKARAIYNEVEMVISILETYETGKNKTSIPKDVMEVCLSRLRQVASDIYCFEE